MKIDKQWLENKDACDDGKNWYLAEGIEDPVEGLKNLIKHEKLDWADWLIVRVMSRSQYVAYSIFAAEQVIDIYEKQYTNDKRPRLAINAAKLALANDGLSAEAAGSAAEAAWSARSAAGSAAEAAADAAWSARSAWSAWCAAEAAADAARSAWSAWSAGSAAWSAAEAAEKTTKKEMQLKILNYGLELLEEKP